MRWQAHTTIKETLHHNVSLTGSVPLRYTYIVKMGKGQRYIDLARIKKAREKFLGHSTPIGSTSFGTKV